MALTTLDPKTALIVVDLQKGIVTYPVVHSIEDCRWCWSTSPAGHRDEPSDRSAT